MIDRKKKSKPLMGHPQSCKICKAHKNPTPRPINMWLTLTPEEYEFIRVHDIPQTWIWEAIARALQDRAEDQRSLDQNDPDNRPMGSRGNGESIQETTHHQHPSNRHQDGGNPPRRLKNFKKIDKGNYQAFQDGTPIGTITSFGDRGWKIEGNNVRIHKTRTEAYEYLKGIS